MKTSTVVTWLCGASVCLCCLALVLLGPYWKFRQAPVALAVTHADEYDPEFPALAFWNVDDALAKSLLQIAYCSVLIGLVYS